MSFYSIFESKDFFLCGKFASCQNENATKHYRTVILNATGINEYTVSTRMPTFRCTGSVSTGAVRVCVSVLLESYNFYECTFPSMSICALWSFPKPYKILRPPLFSTSYLCRHIHNPTHPPSYTAESRTCLSNSFYFRCHIQPNLIPSGPDQ